MIPWIQVYSSGTLPLVLSPQSGRNGTKLCLRLWLANR